METSIVTYKHWDETLRKKKVTVIHVFKCFAGSPCEQVEFFIEEREDELSYGEEVIMPVITSDGKYATGIDPWKFDMKPEFEEGVISLKKGTKGHTLVSVSELETVLSTIEEKYPIKYIIDLVAKSRRIIKSLSEKTALKRSRKTVKKEAVDKKTFIRNLSQTKEIEKVISDSFDEVKVKYVEKIFEGIEQRIAKAQEKIGVNTNVSLIEAFQKSLPKYDGTRYEARQRAKEYLAELYAEVAEFFNDNKEVVDGYKTIFNLVLRNNWKELAYIKAEKYYNHLKEEFLDKNIFKIGTIVHNKKNFVKVVKRHIQLGHIGFEGTFELSFADGSKFDVRSKAVFVWGEIQCKHYRFPTTFHNIVMAEGKHKSMSEEEMVNQFSVK
jgi:hypothetical protein